MHIQLAALKPVV